MNLFIKILLLTFSLVVCFSCSSGETNQSSKEVDKVQTPLKKMPKSSKVQQKASQSQPNTKKEGATADKYWNTLGEELSLDADKLAAIRRLNEKINLEVRDIRTERAKNFEEKTKEIRMGEREQVKKILGESLYQKKLDFDKSWPSRNNSLNNLKKGLKK